MTRIMKTRRYNEVIGKYIFASILIMIIIGTFYTPYDPIAINLDNILSSPSWKHLLGTDQFGRDVFSRIMSAGRISASVSFFAVMIALVLGTFIGVIVGFWGGWVDRVFMVFLDALMALPGILLALAIMMVIGAGMSALIIALGVAYTPNVARLVRGIVLSIKQKEYIEASKVLGNSKVYTVVFHVLPNCITPLTVAVSSLFSAALLAESALSFLGMGVPPPSPTWGGMLADGKQYFSTAPWVSIFPGVVVSLTLLAVNLLGDALRDRFDPRMNNM
ncbi:MAG: ABC transporter permease [Emcibacteraceae bacterium]|nr:ABC transporter permease [Emcibacteraceae bacterium]